MRDRFLGDSLDMSKRAVVSLLRKTGYSFLICPLPSEAEFSETIYRSCLGLEKIDRLFNPASRFRAAQRRKHLDELQDTLSNWSPESSCIVVLDPDKGVHDSRNNNQFITVDEVNSLANAAKGHVVAIYHHKNAGKISYHELVTRFMPLPAIAYNFGAAALCFVHSDSGRLRDIRQTFEVHLARNRVLASF